MKFGSLPLADCDGAILVHSVRFSGGTIKKGTRLGPAEIAALVAAGLGEATVARLEDGDVGEDEAARRIAENVAGPGIEAAAAFTGRANLHAEAGGLVLVERAGIDALNRIDEAITFATLPEFAPVQPGTMVATVKIIPYAVSTGALDAALAAIAPRSLLRLAPFRPLRVGIVQTVLAGTADKVLDKTLRVMRGRLEPTGAHILAERRRPHEVGALADALVDLVAQGAELAVVFGASATSDRLDVVPAAIERAGGRVEHFGMPVDPGNLLVLGRLGETPVLGAPGCARSPKENGFDWVLHRLLAGLDVRPQDITGMGVGGFLMEIMSRPQPREERQAAGAARTGAVLLAAGQARRMGGPNKLTATIGGRPLVRIAAEAILESGVAPLLVVTGHRADAVRAALEGLDVTFVHNADYEAGLSSSLKAGIGAMPETVDAALVCLADMPDVTADIIRCVIAAHEPERGVHVVVPTNEGKRGNPVLWSRRFFAALTALEGDVGARHLIGENADAVGEVEIGPAVSLDLDTPEALAQAGGVPGRDCA